MSTENQTSTTTSIYLKGRRDNAQAML